MPLVCSWSILLAPDKSYRHRMSNCPCRTPQLLRISYSENHVLLRRGERVVCLKHKDYSNAAPLSVPSSIVRRRQSISAWNSHLKNTIVLGDARKAQLPLSPLSSIPSIIFRLVYAASPEYSPFPPQHRCRDIWH